MKIFQITIAVCIFFNVSGYIPIQDKLGIIVEHWNGLTIASVQNRITLSKIVSERNDYSNRKYGLELYLGMGKGVNVKNSIRYDLIRNVLSRNHRNFYIVESNRSGEQVEILSYLIILGEQYASVLVYDYRDQKWVPSTYYQKCSIKFQSELDMERVKKGAGINNEDVIISKFINGKINQSEFFLANTLSGKSGIKGIFGMRVPNKKY